CRDCGVIERLEHILVKCKSPGQGVIWKAAETLWLERESTWPRISLGTVLGCGLAKFRGDGGKVDHGAQRLYRIFISELAYQIWQFRNERVDGAANGSLCEIYSKPHFREHLIMLKRSYYQRTGTEARSGRLDKRAPTSRDVLSFGGVH
ncbi:hypothetical protein GGX14DRAFT_359282, partial [Mycena pura]